MLKSKPDESRDKTLGNGYGSACGSRNEVNHGVATTVQAVEDKRGVGRRRYERRICKNEVNRSWNGRKDGVLCIGRGGRFVRGNDYIMT